MSHQNRLNIKNTRNLLWFLVAVATVVLAILFSHSGKRAQNLSTQSAGAAAIGGPFSLVDTNGSPVTEAQLHGHISLIYFGYSFCPDVCPTTLAAITEGLKQFEAKYPVRSKVVQPIFITVDPERDTPAKMGLYAGNFHPRLLALSGTRAGVDRAMQAYRVFAQKRVEAGDAKNYLVDHASMVYVMGMNGQYLAHVSGAVTPTQIVSALDRAVP